MARLDNCTLPPRLSGHLPTRRLPMLKLAYPALRIFGVVALLLTSVPFASAADKGPGFETDFDRWRAADGAFSGWALSGVVLASDGALQFDPGTATTGSDAYAPGGYNSGSFY